MQRLRTTTVPKRTYEQPIERTTNLTIAKRQQVNRRPFTRYTTAFCVSNEVTICTEKRVPCFDRLQLLYK